LRERCEGLLASARRKRSKRRTAVRPTDDKYERLERADDLRHDATAGPVSWPSRAGSSRLTGRYRFCVQTCGRTARPGWRGRDRKTARPSERLSGTTTPVLLMALVGAVCQSSGSAMGGPVL
jgi:hypothetical protein